MKKLDNNYKVNILKNLKLTQDEIEFIRNIDSAPGTTGSISSAESHELIINFYFQKLNLKKTNTMIKITILLALTSIFSVIVAAIK